jgi:hypothetical protein
MKPMLGKPKWWERKTVENAKFKSHYKAWCVIRRANMRLVSGSGFWFEYKYVAVSKWNVPERYDVESKQFKQVIHVDKLTKEEAVAMAKMLNFVGEVEE